MNQYSNLGDSTEITMKTRLDFTTRIMQSPDELESFLHKTRTRILKEIAALDGSEFNQSPDFSEQMKLIYELQSYGFEAETVKCLELMINRIDELQPGLRGWFHAHMTAFGMNMAQKHQPIKENIYIEVFDDKDGITSVTWCLDTDKEKDNFWKESHFLSKWLLDFAAEQGLNNLVLDTCDHAGHHIQQEIKAPLFQYVQENIELFIKKYIQEGWPRIDA